MRNKAKYITLVLVSIVLLYSNPGFTQKINEAQEPKLIGKKVINLLPDNSLDVWNIPSENWSLEEGLLVGNTGNKVLDKPEWINTKQQFDDFEFTCEMRLTGDNKRNTGIYFRVNMIDFVEKRSKKQYKAASGYEFDAAFHNPGKRNVRGSLGDWYARPSLRILPDQDIINPVYKEEDWNRYTIRVRGNRIEYWLNGIKIIDFTDHDPKASRRGFIGFQIHDGTVMKVEYRNIRVLPL